MKANWSKLSKIVGVFVALMVVSVGAIYYGLRESLDQQVEQVIEDQIASSAESQDSSSDAQMNDSSEAGTTQGSTTISSEDKAKVTKMIVQALTVQQLNEIRKQAQDGFTQSEKQDVKQLIVDELTAEQLAELQEIASKYAASTATE